MSLSKTDQAIATIKFLLKQKQKRIDDIGRKVERSKNEQIFIGQEIDLINNVNILIKQCQGNINAQLGKLPPQDTNIEKGVLGVFLFESSTQSLMDILEPVHFYLETHRILFETMKQMRKAGKPIDIRTVYFQLGHTGQREIVCGEDGPAFIAGLTTKVSTSGNIQEHVRLLIEMAVGREIIIMAGHVMQDAYSGADFSDLLTFAEERINTMKSWIK